MLIKKQKFNKKKKIKLQIIFGLTKAVPKLNLTLAPLNINCNNLLLEFNQYKNIFIEDKYCINTSLIFNTLTPLLIINKIKFSYIWNLIKTLYLNNNIINIFFILIVNNLLKNNLNENFILNCNSNKVYYKFNTNCIPFIFYNTKNLIIINEINLLKNIKNFKYLYYIKENDKKL